MRDKPQTAISIRDIDSVAELRSVEQLQREIWGIPDLDVVPLSHLVAAKESGGLVLGAFDLNVMAGFVYGFVGRENGRTVHHSHMLAVRPEYRLHNIGYRLKLEQRKRVLDEGIEVITWTFDPLQSLNAFFNFRKIGAVADRYLPDFYGSDAASFLHRNGTDRFWVSWHLNGERANAMPKGKDEPVGNFERALVLVGAAGEPILKDDVMPDRPQSLSIEIPTDINAIERHDAALARSWRMATRNAFSEAMANGYMVVDFTRQDRNGRKVGRYTLTKNKG